MVAGMIRRRWMRWGAVGAVAAVALTGCVGEDEPAPSNSAPEPSLSDVEIAAATQDTYQSFLDELYAMYAEFDYDYTRLTPFATDELATSAVADMRMTHDQGLNIESSPQVAQSSFQGGADGGASVDVCVDSRGGRVFDIESGAEWAATGSQINAWNLVVEVDPSGEVLIDERSPLEDDDPICASVS